MVVQRPGNQRQNIGNVGYVFYICHKVKTSSGVRIQQRKGKGTTYLYACAYVGRTLVGERVYALHRLDTVG